MRRHLFTVLSALSLLLGVATAAWWVKTSQFGDYILWHGSWISWSAQGAVAICHFPDPSDDDAGFSYRGGFRRDMINTSGDPGVRLDWRAGPFWLHITRGGYQSQGVHPHPWAAGWAVQAPHWFLIGIALVPPIAWAIRLILRRRSLKQEFDIRELRNYQDTAH